MNESYYSILGVSYDDDTQQITSAYKRKAAAYHPDLNSVTGDEAIFASIQEAYNILIDDKLREEYNIYLSKNKSKFKKDKNAPSAYKKVNEKVKVHSEVAKSKFQKVMSVIKSILQPIIYTTILLLIPGYLLIIKEFIITGVYLVMLFFMFVFVQMIKPIIGIALMYLLFLGMATKSPKYVYIATLSYVVIKFILYVLEIEGIEE